MNCIAERTKCALTIKQFGCEGPRANWMWRSKRNQRMRSKARYNGARSSRASENQFSWKNPAKSTAWIRVLTVMFLALELSNAKRRARGKRLLVRFVRFKRIGYYRRVNSFGKRIITIAMWKTLMQSRNFQNASHVIKTNQNRYQAAATKFSERCSRYQNN